MSLRKIMLTIMASATVLGVGADIQSPIIHARYVRTSRVRRHRTYRRRNFRRAKRIKRTRKHKKAIRNRKSRKSWRINRKRRGRHLTRKVSRIRRPRRTRRIIRRRSYRRVRGLNKYVYNISGHKLLQDMAQDNNTSIHKLLRRYSTNGKSIKAFDLEGALTPITMAKSEAKDENEPFNTFFNMCDPGTGRLTQYDFQGNYMTLTPTQLKHEAKNSGTTVSHLLKHDLVHANKYMNGEGLLTKAGVKAAEQDSINDLNQIRENKGYQPMAENPGLEFIAEKRANTMGNNIEHEDKNGNDYAEMISAKYNIPDYGNENIAQTEFYAFETPSQIAQVDQKIWDAGHRANREDPTNTKVGIGIDPTDGDIVEEFDANI